MIIVVEFLRKKIRLAVIIIMLIVLIIMSTPFAVTVVPSWQLIVTDESGKFLSNVKIEQTWQFYLLETTAHTDNKFTNKNGEVTFSEKHITVFGYQYPLGYIRNIFHGGVHASYGKSSWAIGSTDECTIGSVTFENRSVEPQTLIIAKKPIPPCTDKK